MEPVPGAGTRYLEELLNYATGSAKGDLALPEELRFKNGYLPMVFRIVGFGLRIKIMANSNLKSECYDHSASCNREIIFLKICINFFLVVFFMAFMPFMVKFRPVKPSRAFEFQSQISESE
jgi:hypothetical protein